MGGHNRPYPSLGWKGVDGKQIVWKNGSCDAQSGAIPFCRIPAGELRSSAYVGRARFAHASSSRMLKALQPPKRATGTPSATGATRKP